VHYKYFDVDDENNVGPDFSGRGVYMYILPVRGLSHAHYQHVILHKCIFLSNENGSQKLQEVDIREN